MKGWLRNAAVIVLMSTASQGTGAATIDISPSPGWPGVGGVAGNCNFSYPTLQPLSRQRTLLVDNDLPVGSVLYSWGYSDFAPNFIGMCNTATTYLTQIESERPVGTAELFLNFYGEITNDSRGYYWKTNNPGIGLKLYVTPMIIKKENTNSIYGLTSELALNGRTLRPLNVGQETEILTATYSSLIHLSFMSQSQGGFPNTQQLMGSDINYISFSIRGELIKIGNIQPSNALSLSGEINLESRTFPTPGDRSIGASSTYDMSILSIFGGNGITIATPSCRLRGATDYQVDLGQWSAHGTDGLPAHSAIKPIDINLECSGKVNNVNFSFQDTGAHPLESKNISVYDSSGGQSIDGLEIEMSYQGLRRDVSNSSEPTSSYPVSTGTMGAVKENPEDLSYNSQGSAQFGARFVQRGEIKRNGVSYTGPVSGQVNMFVTYN